jgi:hypothetical protein
MNGLPVEIIARYATSPPHGGTERRPTTTACNLRAQLQLPRTPAAREPHSSTMTNPRRRPTQGEHLAPRGCSPTVFPLLKALIEQPSLNTDPAMANEI